MTRNLWNRGTSFRRAVIVGLGLAAFLGIARWSASRAADNISANGAKDHIGSRETVCGIVAGAKYAASSKGQPTFLNLDRPYPNQIFTAVIWGSDRGRFAKPPEEFQGTRVCVTGTIKTYQGRPEIEVHDPSQLTNEGASIGGSARSAGDHGQGAAQP